MKGIIVHVEVPGVAALAGVSNSVIAPPVRGSGYRRMIARLHLEQPGLRRRIGLEPVIPIEMVGRDVEQHCDVAIEALRQVELVAR